MSTRKFGGRTLARSQALQLLFQAEILDASVSEVLAGPYALGQWPLDEYAERLALGADEERDELDEIISRFSTNWPIDRMPAVDRNLLRMALYEMREVDEVAIAVTIDESVELAKAFGTDESSRFVNGLLGRVATELENNTLQDGLELQQEQDQEQEHAQEQEPDQQQEQAQDEGEAEQWPDA